MKKLILPITILLASCGPSAEEKQTETKRLMFINETGINVYLTEIDSCEYLITPKGIIHKGNCKYCKTRK
jgi:hypothetical protein